MEYRKKSNTQEQKNDNALCPSEANRQTKSMRKCSQQKHGTGLAQGEQS